MKKIYTFIFTAILGLNFSFAQFVETETIVETNINLSSSTVLGQLTINPTTAGKAIVHFDGVCISDPGDRIVLAASNTTSYGINDGNIGVEAIDADVNRNPFSHTRVYDVSAGSHTFYAIGHNYVETDGSGIASIYGRLTVKFVPTSNFLVGFTGISQTSVNLSSSTALGQVTISPASSGKVIVSFDGSCISDAGDRIVLAASNTTSWGSNDGNIGVEAFDNDVNSNSFSHTRVYDVNAGSHTFYALGQNYVETDGSGIASIYGSLTVQFIPTGNSLVAFTGIIKTSADLNSLNTLGQATINAAANGKAIVRFDGVCISDPGDRIVLAASNTAAWGSNEGNTNFEAFDTDINRKSFSHTMVYDVTPGSVTFYAVGQNYVETDGSGIASIYGSLTVDFIADNSASAEYYSSDQNSLLIYPNPSSDFLTISLTDFQNSKVYITDMNGKQVYKSDLTDSEHKLFIGNFAVGIYMVHVISDKGMLTKKIIKN